MPVIWNYESDIRNGGRRWRVLHWLVSFKLPSMSLDHVVKGLEIVIETAALYETDAALAAGAEH